MNWDQLLCSDRIRTITKSTTSRDLRTEFEKDYHRIIGSAAFRRLQDKTQVFPLDKSDFIRTRLTHSLEVSSFARSLGQNVGEKIIAGNIDPEFGVQQKEDICAILQCAGLIHDIGNPPFGHFGETAIQDWFKENLSKLTFKGKSVDSLLSEQMKQDFYNFEGNTQALRVVSKLHFLVDEHGMNLTKALLATIIKYPVSSLDIDKKSGNIKTKKMGYLYAEKDIFEDIQKSVGTNGSRHPLTYLLEAADDIAYKTADIEDSIKKGCITYAQLVDELKSLEIYKDESSVYHKAIDMLEHKYEKAVKNKVEKPDVYAVQNWVISIQGQMLFAASDSFINNYREIMDGTYRFDLFYGTEEEDIMDILGDIAYRYSFTSMPIYKLEIAADTIFKFLLDRFVEAVINYDTEEKMSVVSTRVVALISDDYRRIYKVFSEGKSEEEKLYLRLVLATDYICGMTDSFAKNLYQELNGIV
ncbi:MAG: deoxyguanosinetriphosphate triphosphohydrolase [Lachnospiraceae bacterium]|nr:deoxyguanosinetriphosphate triphosphohydrolase [Lachnospiraceae bacterium]